MTTYHWKPEQPFNELPSLPPENFSNTSISPEILNKTHIAIAELRGYTMSFAENNLHHLLHPLFLVESLSSSEIENIVTTLQSVLEHQLENEIDESADQKVLNYRNALLWGWQQITNNEPITERFVKGLHECLLPQESHDWRREQNQIINEKTKEVRYTPPAINNIPQFFSRWENFVNQEDTLDPLIVSALAHYQFESIHPFNDGNGRTGRMLLTLQPVKSQLLLGPFVHISRYINDERPQYYDLLLRVTKDENWKEFVEYILEGYYQQAVVSRVTLMSLSAKQEEIKQKIKRANPKIFNVELVEKLFEFPVINPSRLAKEIDVHYQTASKYLQAIEGLGILKSYKKGRNMFYVNFAALDIISSKQRNACPTYKT